MMLQLGSYVLSVEPQPDLAIAIRETAELNCWGYLSTVLNARACARKAGSGCLRPSTEGIEGWRDGCKVVRGNSNARSTRHVRCVAR